MRLLAKIPQLCLLFGLSLSLGCSSREYVRHLPSDASLVTPQQTTKAELNAYLGPPEKKQALTDGREEWTYFQQNKSLMRKTPYLGATFGLGSEHYDVMVVVFQGEVVASCQYRMFTKEEFDQSHIDNGIRPDAN